MGNVLEVSPAYPRRDDGFRRGGAPDFRVPQEHECQAVVLAPVRDGCEVEKDAVEFTGGRGVLAW